MASSYEAPAEVRELEKRLNDFSYRKGYNIDQVFDDFLRYIIWAFSLDGKPIDNWKYKKEEQLFFLELLQEWISVMDKQIALHEWYDAFGDLYMSCIASSGRQSGRAQFFTPPGICDLMVAISDNGEKKTTNICSDPTCGSGCNLLAFHIKHLGNYLCAEDIDQTCCMMTVCNFICHGAVGEVICHDSLNPDSWFYGWKVNEGLNNPLSKYYGIPHVRSIEKEESYVWQNWQNMKAEYEKKKHEVLPADPPLTTPQQKSQPVQLSLFD